LTQEIAKIPTTIWTRQRFDSVGVIILGPLLDPSNIEYKKSDKDMFREARSSKLFFKEK